MLALSQLVQPCIKMVQSGVVLRLEARYCSAPIGVQLFGYPADLPFGCCFQCVTAIVPSIFNLARNAGGISPATVALPGRATGLGASAGAPFFFVPFGCASANARRISSEAPDVCAPRSAPSRLTGGVIDV